MQKKPELPINAQIVIYKANYLLNKSNARRGGLLH